MSDCLNNEEQISSQLNGAKDSINNTLNVDETVTSSLETTDSITSNLSTTDNTTSQMNNEDPLDSVLDQPTVYKYVGGKTDNIIVEVDNTGRIIYANLQQIKFKTFADFPQPGSDRLIYIDATSNTLYSWDSDAQAYTKLVADVNIPTNLSEFKNDGDGDSPFATEDYVQQNGGKIDSISVNGVPQEIDENKNVDIKVSGTGGGTTVIWEVWE